MLTAMALVVEGMPQGAPSSAIVRGVLSTRADVPRESYWRQGVTGKNGRGPLPISANLVRGFMGVGLQEDGGSHEMIGGSVTDGACASAAAGREARTRATARMAGTIFRIERPPHQV